MIRNPWQIVCAPARTEYLITPFVPAEFVARVLRLVRRSVPQVTAADSASVTFNATLRSVSDDEACAFLTEREWAIVDALRRGGNVPTPMLTLSLTGWGDGQHTQTVVTTLSRLRRKLREAGV